MAALTRALDGVTGTTAVHVCFGYGALVKGRPRDGYSFLSELNATPVEQVSIESAQSALDCSVLEPLAGKTIILGVLDLSTAEVETPDVVAARIRRALPYVAPERLVIAPDCGMKYLSRESAFSKLCSLVEGASIVRAELSTASVGTR